MKLVGLMPVRNEDWVLGLSARVALQWCDELVIFMHACTDGSTRITRELIGEKPGRVHPAACGGDWNEMEHRHSMLLEARRHGGTHIAMIDADEILTANLLPDQQGTGEPGTGAAHGSAICVCARCLTSRLAPGQMLELPGYNLRGSLDRYHANGIWGNRWFSLAFKDTPEAHWGGDKFHSRAPSGVKWQTWRPIKQGEGGVMHLWGASERRLRAKSALYKITERLRWPDKPVQDIEKMYNWAITGEPGHPSYGAPESWMYADVPVKSWWAHQLGPKESPIDFESEPWQEAEIRRLVAEHGRERFAGLDLFGIV